MQYRIIVTEEDHTLAVKNKTDPLCEAVNRVTDTKWVMTLEGDIKRRYTVGFGETVITTPEVKKWYYAWFKMMERKKSTFTPIEFDIIIQEEKGIMD